MKKFKNIKSVRSIINYINKNIDNNKLMIVQLYTQTDILYRNINRSVIVYDSIREFDELESIPDNAVSFNITTKVNCKEFLIYYVSYITSYLMYNTENWRLRVQFLIEMIRLIKNTNLSPKVIRESLTYCNYSDLSIIALVDPELIEKVGFNYDEIKSLSYFSLNFIKNSLDRYYSIA